MVRFLYAVQQTTLNLFHTDNDAVRLERPLCALKQTDHAQPDPYWYKDAARLERCCVQPNRQLYCLYWLINAARLLRCLCAVKHTTLNLLYTSPMMLPGW